jgi:hypothetical protein
VDEEFVEDYLPDDGERGSAVDALVRAGLWEEDSPGWSVHDFLKYNPSKAEAEMRRETDRRRKRGGSHEES